MYNNKSYDCQCTDDRCTYFLTAIDRSGFIKRERNNRERKKYRNCESGIIDVRFDSFSVFIDMYTYISTCRDVARTFVFNLYLATCTCTTHIGIYYSVFVI